MVVQEGVVVVFVENVQVLGDKLVEWLVVRAPGPINAWTGGLHYPVHTKKRAGAGGAAFQVLTWRWLGCVCQNGTANAGPWRERLCTDHLIEPCGRGRTTAGRRTGRAPKMLRANKVESKASASGMHVGARS